MTRTMVETERRRKKQLQWNKDTGSVPRSTKGSEIKSIFDLFKEEAGEGMGEAEEKLKAEVAKRNRKKFKNEMVDASVKRTKAVGGTSGGEDGGDQERASSAPTLEDLASNLPQLPGVYLWRDRKDGEILYIGKAKSLKARVAGYLTGKDPRPRINLMMKEKARWLDFHVTETEHDALHLESKLVNVEQPPYNVMLKDDHSKRASERGGGWCVCVGGGGEREGLMQEEEKEKKREDL